MVMVIVEVVMVGNRTCNMNIGYIFEVAVCRHHCLCSRRDTSLQPKGTDEKTL